MRDPFPGLPGWEIFGKTAGRPIERYLHGLDGKGIATEQSVRWLRAKLREKFPPDPVVPGFLGLGWLFPPKPRDMAAEPIAYFSKVADGIADDPALSRFFRVDAHTELYEAGNALLASYLTWLERQP
jgi:hypothetical protein